MGPDELIQQIREAFERKDGQRIVDLCNSYGADIYANFQTWLRVPEEIRHDADSVEAWSRPLVFLAQMFNDSGHPELLEQLYGKDKVIEGWQSSIANAAQLIEAGRYREAADVIQAILPELEHASGGPVDDIRPKAYGLLAKAQFESGDAVQAKKFMQLALDDCRRTGDEEGIRNYTSNLRVMKAAAASIEDSEDGKRLLAIRAAIARAQELSDDAEFEKSNDVLATALKDHDGVETMLEFRGKVWGLLGLNFYRLGNFAESRRYTEMALEQCTNAKDQDGIRIYSANLQEIARQPV